MVNPALTFFGIFESRKLNGSVAAKSLLAVESLKRREKINPKKCPLGSMYFCGLLIEGQNLGSEFGVRTLDSYIIVLGKWNYGTPAAD